MDMLAIDLVDPTTSQLKIYVRSRETSFSSLERTMTLGNRISTPELAQGLRNLKRLWDALFELGAPPDSDAPLPICEHPTAGILYNIELGLGSVQPKVKVYIPVRHYARNDARIAQAVGQYLDEVNGPSCRYVPGYGQAIGAIL